MIHLYFFCIILSLVPIVVKYVQNVHIFKSLIIPSLQAWCINPASETLMHVIAESSLILTPYKSDMTILQLCFAFFIYFPPVKNKSKDKASKQGFECTCRTNVVFCSAKSFSNNTIHEFKALLVLVNFLLYASVIY